MEEKGFWGSIFYPLWKWLINIPIFLISTYNVLREEGFLNLPPLWGILDNWSWQTWGVVWLICLVIIILYSAVLYGKRKDRKTSNKEVSLNLETNHQTSRLNVSQNLGEINFYDTRDGINEKDDDSKIINEYSSRKDNEKNLKIIFDRIVQSQDSKFLSSELSVISEETRNIIELEARVEIIRKYYISSEKEIQCWAWRILPDKNMNILDKSKIRPDVPLLIKFTSFNNNLSVVKFGNLAQSYPINSEETIFKINLGFSGKLEGKMDFRKLDMEIDIYVHPPRNICFSASHASNFNLMSDHFKEKYTAYRKSRTINNSEKNYTRKRCQILLRQ